MRPDHPDQGDVASSDEAVDDRGSRPSDETILAPGRRRNAAPVGDEFAGYEILGELGRGSMGIVYKARQTELDRLVALKVIIAGEDASEDDISRFMREARASAKMEHPNIVPVYDVGHVASKHYFTMAFVEGRTLADFVRETGPTLNQSVVIMRKLASAINYAHERGVIHRDLKPGNVMVDEAGEPHVMDFGLARNIQEESSLTKTGDLMGTPAYMPPEQVEGKVHALDERTDIWSIGVMLYEIAAGKLPFADESPLRVLMRVLEDDPAGPRKVSRKTPHDLDTIVMKCLEKDPERRYRTAGALAEDLGRFLSGDAIAARPPSVSYRFRKKVWKHRGWAAGISVAALALAVALFFGLGLWESVSRFAAGWELVLAEDFSSGKMPEGWEIPKGTVDFRDGTLVMTHGVPRPHDPPNPFGLCVVVLPGNCPDAVRLEYDAWFPSNAELGDKACDLSCVMHMEKRALFSKAYALQFGSIGNKCSRLLRESAALLTNVHRDALIVPGKRHRVVAEHAGEYVTLWVDGKQVLRLRDFFPLTGGRICLYSWGKGGARFDNLKLYKRGRALDVSALAVPDAFFAGGDHERAAEEYAAIWRSHPGTAEGRIALYKRALALILLEEDDEARQALAGLVETDMAGWARLGLAELEARAGRGAEAVEEIKRATAAGDPEVAGLARTCTTRLAYDAARRGDGGTSAALLREARRDLEGWQIDRLGCEMVWYSGGLGAYAYFRGDLPVAAATAEAVMAAFPDRRKPWCPAARMLALVHRDYGRFEEAIEQFALVLERWPEEKEECAWSLYETATCLREAGRHEEALRACQRVARQYPDRRGECAGAARETGLVLWAMGRLEKAVAAFGRVEREYPDQAEECAIAALSCGIVRLKLGDGAGAAADWRKVAENHVNDRGSAALARYFLGELDEAAFLKELKTKSRRYWNDASLDVARKLEAEGRMAEAARWCRKCLELSEGDEWPALLARRRLKELEE